MLSKSELLEHMNNYVRFTGFTDNEILENNNTVQTRTDWHGNEFLFNQDFNIKFPYNNSICKVVENCDDNSIICEFDSINPNTGQTADNQKVLIAFIFQEDANQLINYNPMFQEL